MQITSLEMSEDLAAAFFNPRVPSLFRKTSRIQTRFLATRAAALA